jgi:hypothetical protein
MLIAQPIGNVTRIRPRYIILVSFKDTKLLRKTPKPAATMITVH